MGPISQLRETEAAFSVLRMRYRDKGASLAQTSWLRMELRKAERVRDGIASEIKELCHG